MYPIIQFHRTLYHLLKDTVSNSNYYNQNYFLISMGVCIHCIQFIVFRREHHLIVSVVLRCHQCQFVSGHHKVEIIILTLIMFFSETQHKIVLSPTLQKIYSISKSRKWNKIFGKLCPCMQIESKLSVRFFMEFFFPLLDIEGCNCDRITPDKSLQNTEIDWLLRKDFKIHRLAGC